MEQIPMVPEKKGVPFTLKIRLHLPTLLRLILPAAVQFCMGRVLLFGGAAPFGIACYGAAVQILGRRHRKLAQILLGVSGCVAAATLGNLPLLLREVLIYLLYSLLHLLYTLIRGDKPSLPVAALLTAMTVLTGGMTCLLQYGFYTYDIAILSVEALLAGVSVVIFGKSIGILLHERDRLLSPEEWIALFLTAGIALAGLADIMLGSVGILRTVSAFLLLLCGFVCGVGVSAPVGVGLGLLNGMGGFYTAEVLGVFSLCGLLCGILCFCRRPGVIFGLIAGNALLSVYFGAGDGIPLSGGEMAAAILAFVLVPERVLLGMKRMLPQGALSGRQMMNEMVTRLKELAVSFDSLAKTYLGLGAWRDSQPNFSGVFDRTAENICKYCTRCRQCWEEDFMQTRQAMIRLLPALRSKGMVTAEDLPDTFAGSCLRCDLLVREINNQTQREKLAVKRRSGSPAAKHLVFAQMKGVSSLLRRTAEGIGERKKKEENRYRLCCSGAAQAASPDGSNGDSYTFLPIGEHKFLMLLSDGMGNGKEAQGQSADTVRLLKELLQTGFDEENAIEIINAALMLGEDKESFSTMDIVLFDGRTGALEFVKMGANAGYHCSGAKVERIASRTLPVGIVDQVDIEITARKGQEGDLIVLLSDGVEDAAPLWVEKYLRKLPTDLSEGKIAELLLAEARRQHGDLCRDDMTVVVGRVHAYAG